MTASIDEQKAQDEMVLSYLKEYSDGILQSDLWKGIGIDSRTCSRIVMRLEAAGRITREETHGQVHSYLIRGVKTKKQIDTSLLLAGTVIVPCVACDEECDVPSCKLLEDWIYELVFSEME